MLDWVHKSFNELETGQKLIFNSLMIFPPGYMAIKKKNKLIANLLARMNPTIGCIGDFHGVRSLLSSVKGVDQVLFVWIAFVTQPLHTDTHTYTCAYGPGELPLTKLGQLQVALGCTEMGVTWAFWKEKWPSFYLEEERKTMYFNTRGNASPPALKWNVEGASWS